MACEALSNQCVIQHKKFAVRPAERA